MTDVGNEQKSVLIHICLPSQITDEWLEVHADVIRVSGGMPTCKYCGKRCRKGSYADHLYPYYQDECFHVACAARKGEW
jgi:hypothetical protein